MKQVTLGPWTKDTIPFEKFARLYLEMKAEGWDWLFNERCKYVNLRFDDGDVAMFDRRGRPIDLDDLGRQSKVLPKVG